MRCSKRAGDIELGTCMYVCVYVCMYVRVCVYVCVIALYYDQDWKAFSYIVRMCVCAKYAYTHGYTACIYVFANFDMQFDREFPTIFNDCLLVNWLRRIGPVTIT
jgi:hypothetical protein